MGGGWMARTARTYVRTPFDSPAKLLYLLVLASVRTTIILKNTVTPARDIIFRRLDPDVPLTVPYPTTVLYGANGRGRRRRRRTRQLTNVTTATEPTVERVSECK